MTESSGFGGGRWSGPVPPLLRQRCTARLPARLRLLLIAALEIDAGPWPRPASLRDAMRPATLSLAPARSPVRIATLSETLGRAIPRRGQLPAWSATAKRPQRPGTSPEE